jgi:hypothetical protein
VLDVYDVVLSYYHQVRRSERDDKRWILLQHPSGYALEVERTRRQLGEIRPLPSQQARRLARELDQGETRYRIKVEPGSALPSPCRMLVVAVLGIVKLRPGSNAGHVLAATWKMRWTTVGTGQRLPIVRRHGEDEVEPTLCLAGRRCG